MHPSGVTSSAATPPVDGRTHTSAGSEPELPPVVPLAQTVSVSLKAVVEVTQLPTVKLWADASCGDDSDNKAIARSDRLLSEVTAARRGELIDTSANRLCTSLFYTLNPLPRYI